MDTDSAILELTTFDLGIVALVYFDGWTQDGFNLDSDHLLLRPMTMEVDSHHVTVTDQRIPDRKWLIHCLFVTLMIIFDLGEPRVSKTI